MQKELKLKINEIILKSQTISDKYLSDVEKELDYVAINTSSQEEYDAFISYLENNNNKKMITSTGNVYKIASFETVIGCVDIIKIRKASENTKIGYVDYIVKNYEEFKSNNNFKSIIRPDMEMLELELEDIDVNIYVPNISIKDRF